MVEVLTTAPSQASPRALGQELTVVRLAQERLAGQLRNATDEVERAKLNRGLQISARYAAELEARLDDAQPPGFERRDG